MRFSIAGVALLLALAGCGRSFLQFAERAPWREEAEVACMRSGAVKTGGAVVQIESIDGPGVCGAAFPLKVAALGDSAALGYGDDLRPPGSIPNGASSQMPRWPAGQSHYPTQPGPVNIAPPAQQPMRAAPGGQQMRWVTGAPPAIDPPPTQAPAGRPMPIHAPDGAIPDDIPDDAELPAERAPAAAPPLRTQQVYNAPVYQQPEQPRDLPRLGPMRGPAGRTAAMPAAVNPPATLACPIVSALDRWVSEGVQPAAMRWFGSPVAEIKQISAYSCRGMVGAGGHGISEHAFGNALDIAGFTLADGRKISVQHGWRGTPEEQGFLHDVQLNACEVFNTVLAPGYNAAHYNHIHVDLMRRASGRRPCRPNAIPGEVVAAKARAVYASRGRDHTGSVSKSGKPVTLGGLIQEALAGEDGYVADEDGDEATGSIPQRAEPPKAKSSGGTFGRWFGGSSSSARKGAGSPDDRMTKNY